MGWIRTLMLKDSPLSSTILPSPWLGVTRVIWVILSIAAILLSTIGLVKSVGEPLPSCTSGSAPCAPWTVSREDIAVAQGAGLPIPVIIFAYYFASIFPKLAFGLVGLLIFWRRSQDWVAQGLSLMLVLFILEGITNLGELQPFADILYAVSTFIFGVLPFVFPNGRFVPASIAWLALPNALLSTIGVFAPQLGLPLEDRVYAALIIMSFLIWFFLAVYSVAFRFRYVSNAIERQQTKWAIAGLLGSFSLIVPFAIISVFYPPSQPSLGRFSFIFLVHYPIYFASYLFISGGIAFAIFRYRLWDIDILIRRTLQYSVFTGLLALLYFGGVVTLQALLSLFTGQVKSPLVTILTTLGIAALFNPLRRQVQEFIDYRFYRKKYIAEMALAAFAIAARDEVNVDRLASALIQVVDETIQPESNWIWLKKD